VIDIYDLKLIPERSDDPQGFIHRSDSGSFIGWGYPAILISEDWDDHTPYYHTASDRLSTLDLNYYTSVTRAAIAAIAHLAMPLD
jgi:Iap family predicted aminopeptidase